MDPDYRGVSPGHLMAVPVNTSTSAVIANRLVLPTGLWYRARHEPSPRFATDARAPRDAGTLASSRHHGAARGVAEPHRVARRWARCRAWRRNRTDPWPPAGVPPDDLFQTSSDCLACHNGLTTPAGEDVSIGVQWRTSMMANSSREPLLARGGAARDDRSSRARGGH